MTIATRTLDIDLAPEDAFAALRGEPYPFWLDAATGNGWSYVGAAPRDIFEAPRDASAILDRVDAWLARHGGEGVAGPTPFPFGAVGFLSYDLKDDIERLPRTALDDLGHPAVRLAWYDAVAAYEHASNRWHLAWNDAAPGTPALADSWEARWRETRRLPPPPAPVARAPAHGTLDRDAYEDAVRRVKRHIAAGDVYQLNLSRRIELPWPGDGWNLYRRLRRASPAPFAAYLPWPGLEILSSSPELFLDRDGVRVRTRPIKGTAPRGADSAEDVAARLRLESSEKERAELVMIVDLERNDLGRVCLPGSVRATCLGRTETYETVHHRVATVEGVLRPGVGTAALLRATFPGGSITGAPKIRAMELIEGIEPTARGVYTGAVGWIGPGGRMGLNVAIRTATLQAGRLAFQVGGGIVADSDPSAEYEETVHKAAGMLRALGIGAVSGEKRGGPARMGRGDRPGTLP